MKRPLGITSTIAYQIHLFLCPHHNQQCLLKPQDPETVNTMQLNIAPYKTYTTLRPRVKALRSCKEILPALTNPYSQNGQCS
jgi:hypothetical protein